jgi:EthD domain
MHKVFHMLVPRGDPTMNPCPAAEFHTAWDGHATMLAQLAGTSDGFRFYTRTPRTEPLSQPRYPGDPRFVYEGVETVGFDTLQNAGDFRDAARKLDTSLFGNSSAWLIAEEHLHTNGAPQGPLDTGPGIHVITSMRRRQGMTLAEFRRHQDDHARLVVLTQGISRYAVNLVVDAEYAVDEPPVDAVIEVWFRTSEDMRACFSDPSMTGVQQVHNRLFVDTSTFFALQCRDAEQWVVGARAPAMGSVP